VMKFNGGSRRRTIRMYFFDAGHSAIMLIVVVREEFEQSCVTFFTSQRGNFVVLKPDRCEAGNGSKVGVRPCTCMSRH
jgi:hypothetical protein